MGEIIVVEQMVNKGRSQALQAELAELIEVVEPASLIELLIERAYQLRATDIHFDASAEGLRIRLRVDGLLHDLVQIPAGNSAQVLSRLKIAAGMDITERRFSQDGRITSQYLDRKRDIRVCSGPTIHGERMVLRLMPDGSGLRRLEDLGLEPDQVQQVQRYISSPYGMILSVGPVGSGKSTTMYNCLELLNIGTDSLVTIEDPVERRVPGVNQIQVDPKINFNFVDALRGVLRQDPDVIMIGEIRDPETAQIGVRAGLTGVTVLSTMHATDTATAIDVFRQFEIPPIFLADSLQGIIAQRLLRRVCTQCRETVHPDEAEATLLGVSTGTELAAGRGCDACFHTGYLGRTGVFECLGLDEEFRHGILAGLSRGDLSELAHRHGMQTLQESATRKVLAGVTTLQEMHRVLISLTS